MASSFSDIQPCGCWYPVAPIQPNSPFMNSHSQQQYLPQVDLKVHSTILSTTSRTALTQTFITPAKEGIENVKYTFPLYDGVSVVGFRCEIGDRVIYGVVKERQKAKAEYKEAVKQGRKAALLEQSLRASDTFTTNLGNLPAASQVVVHITYLGELQHDAQADGIRFTVPSQIAPRYQNAATIDHATLPEHIRDVIRLGSINVTVDVEMPSESKILALQSPSHPVTMTLGRTSVAAEDVFQPNYASTAFMVTNLQLATDFVLIVKATNQDAPTALLETHPSIPNQRAIMTSLVPRFNLPNHSPEMVFIIDRSGSMRSKIGTLRSALLVLLKSLPVGTKFNICSFGSTYSFMWDKSRTYDAEALDNALSYVDTIWADMGGTEMLAPVRATVENRFKDMATEVLLLTDGQIWDQTALFAFVNESVADQPIRFFSLGIGDAASHSLVQGIARAGNGFAQSVGEDEELDKKMLRMLKGALTPHIKDYTLEVEYDQADDEEYEIVEKPNDIPSAPLEIRPKQAAEVSQKEPISLFDPNYKEPEMEKTTTFDVETDLPPLSAPKILQAPYRIPQLYPFSRTSVYLLLSPKTNPRTPKSVSLRATSPQGPLALRIPIENVGQGSTIHKLSARKLMLELEEGRGWVHDAKDTAGNVVVARHESKKEDLVKREAVRLGVQFQIGGKWCSFVAVEKDASDDNGPEKELDAEMVDEGMIDEEDYTGAPDWEAHQYMQQPMFACIPMPKSKARRGLPPSERVRSGDTRRSVMFTDASTDSEPSERSGQIDRRESGQASPFGALGSQRPRLVGGGSSQFRARARASHTDAAQPDSNVHTVISQQLFEGSWDWTTEIFDTMGVTSTDVENKLDWASILGVADSQEAKKDEKARKIFVTLAVVAYLRSRWPNEKETWELVADKALAWVNASIADIGGEELMGQKGDERMARFGPVFPRSIAF